MRVRSNKEWERYERPPGVRAELWKDNILRPWHSLSKSKQRVILFALGLGAALIAMQICAVVVSALAPMRGKHYLIGTWELSGVKTMDSVFSTEQNTSDMSFYLDVAGSANGLSAMSVDQVAQLMGKYLVFEEGGTYYSSASKKPQQWDYTNGTYHIRNISGEEESISDRFLDVLVKDPDDLVVIKGNNLLYYDKVGGIEANRLAKEGLAPVEYNAASTMQSSADWEYMVDTVAYGGEDFGDFVSMGGEVDIGLLTELAPDDIWQRYDMMSQTGQLASIFLSTDNTYTAVMGVEANEPLADFSNQLIIGGKLAGEAAAERQQIREYNAQVKLYSPEVFEGRWELCETGMLFVEGDGGVERLSTSGQYMYANPLEGQIIYDTKEINPLEKGGYVLEAELTSPDTGVQYIFHIDGTAEVISGAELQYIYNVDRDGIIEMIPRVVTGESYVADYLYFERSSNTVYRLLFERSSWMDTVDANRMLDLPMCTASMAKESAELGDTVWARTIVRNVLLTDAANYDDVRIDAEKAAERMLIEQEVAYQKMLEEEKVARERAEYKAALRAREEQILAEQEARAKAAERQENATANIEQNTVSDEDSLFGGSSSSGSSSATSQDIKPVDGVTGAEDGPITVSGNRNPYSITPANNTVYLKVE